MPGMNGREVAETLLLRRPATPVLYASGYNEEMVVERGALDPSISYIAKPYSGVDLLRRIQELVRKHEPGI
jgi:CheY-like chemotaxis protein